MILHCPKLYAFNYNRSKFVSVFAKYTIYTQGGTGHWAVYYTSPQSIIIFFLIRWRSNFGNYYSIIES